jgi:folate-dependent phosphoribosylglycinamide formyltransferase PurN
MAKPKLPSMRTRPNAGDPYGKVDVLDANRERRGVGLHLVASGVDPGEVAAVWRKYISSQSSTECVGVQKT